VPGMAEDHEVREYVKRFFRHDGCVGGKTLRYFPMANYTLGHQRETGPFAGDCLGMAVNALDFQAGMPLVAKWSRGQYR